MFRGTHIFLWLLVWTNTQTVFATGDHSPDAEIENASEPNSTGSLSQDASKARAKYKALIDKDDPDKEKILDLLLGLEEGKKPPAGIADLKTATKILSSLKAESEKSGNKEDSEKYANLLKTAEKELGDQTAFIELSRKIAAEWAGSLKGNATFDALTGLLGTGSKPSKEENLGSSDAAEKTPITPQSKSSFSDTFGKLGSGLTGATIGAIAGGTVGGVFGAVAGAALGATAAQTADIGKMVDSAKQVVSKIAPSYFASATHGPAASESSDPADMPYSLRQTGSPTSTAYSSPSAGTELGSGANIPVVSSGTVKQPLYRSSTKSPSANPTGFTFHNSTETGLPNSKGTQSDLENLIESAPHDLSPIGTPSSNPAATFADAPAKAPDSVQTPTPERKRSFSVASNDAQIVVPNYESPALNRPRTSSSTSPSPTTTASTGLTNTLGVSTPSGPANVATNTAVTPSTSTPLRGIASVETLPPTPRSVPRTENIYQTASTSTESNRPFSLESEGLRNSMPEPSEPSPSLAESSSFKRSSSESETGSSTSDQNKIVNAVDLAVDLLNKSPKFKTSATLVKPPALSAPVAEALSVSGIQNPNALKSTPGTLVGATEKKVPIPLAYGENLPGILKATANTASKWKTVNNSQPLVSATPAKRTLPKTPQDPFKQFFL